MHGRLLLTQISFDPHPLFPSCLECYYFNKCYQLFRTSLSKWEHVTWHHEASYLDGVILLAWCQICSTKYKKKWCQKIHIYPQVASQILPFCLKNTLHNYLCHIFCTAHKRCPLLDSRNRGSHIIYLQLNLPCSHRAARLCQNDNHDYFNQCWDHD